MKMKKDNNLQLTPDGERFKNYCSWRGKYRVEKIYFRQLDGGKRYAYFKRKANHCVRRSQDFSTRKSNDYRKVYDYVWKVY